MTLPAYAYRDPAEVIEQIDTSDVRMAFGCAACIHRCGQLLGRHLCGKGNKPNRMGFCRRWHLDDDWHDDTKHPRRRCADGGT